MPAFALSNWNLSTVTLASTKSKSQRNKLRRRRRPPPLRDMSGDQNGAHDGAEFVPPIPTPMTATSTARSISPTLHEKHTSEPKDRDSDKDDAQAQVISSLRAQITDLITQVSQLNSKLVKSYDRVSDLEDEVHVASANARTSALKISNLEIERAQHLAALNTGLYVEKEHVTAELTRLMERATSEAAARGQAESARANIERELDDLSASLFDQANTMVAEARLGRAMSERKVVEAEMALKSAEEAVGVMQTQMQALRDEKDRSDDEITRLRTLMQKGKFIEHPPIAARTSIKLLRLHVPYQEFVQFIAHLRSIRHSSFNIPPISTLLPLPLLARMQNEDSDPTVRLDLAPSLNWLSRRSVLAAIHCGQLTIEPMSITTLINESTSGSGIQSMIAGSHPGIVCALCGARIYPPKSAESPGLPPPSHPLSSLSLGRHSSGTWSTSLFKNPLSNAAPSPPPTPPRETSAPATPTKSNIDVTTVYVFRLAQAQTSHPPSSYSQSQLTQPQKVTSYPLCASGWCLARLQTTCSLWAFIRAGVIDRVWEEAPAPRAPPSVSSASVYSVNSSANNSSTFTLVSAPFGQREKEAAPPLPPRRRSKMSSGVGALWGMASEALRSSSLPSSPVANGEKEKDKRDLSETPPKKAAPEPLKVIDPPPPPPGSNRRASETDEMNDERPKEDMLAEVKRANLDQNSDMASSTQNTPVTRSKSASPPARPTLETHQMKVANSQTSSALGEEFSTPVEEIGSLPLSLAAGTTDTETSTADAGSTLPRPATPHSKRSSRSSARNSLSPPPRSPSLNPRRVSSPPPPHSPRAIPLPDSRPGTPGTPHRIHARRESVPIAPLNIDPEKTSRPPSRAASPRPVGTVQASTPPPLPRRAAARRAVPPPPSSSGVQRVATPPSSGSNDEKGASTPPSSTSSQENHSSQEDRATTTKAEEHDGMPMKAMDGPRPRLPPRRPGHSAQNSINSIPDNRDDGGRIEATQERTRRETPSWDVKINATNGDVPEDDSSKNFVGDASWEERTWKEIVRLREDMFWARIGAMRG